MNKRNSQAGSSSCQCSTTLYGEQTEKNRNVLRIQIKFRSTLAGFFVVVFHSWDLDQKRNGTKTCSDKLDGNWGRTAEMTKLQLTAESGHPIFRASSAYERGELGSKGHGKKSTQISDNEGNIEMLLRTVISVNQLSIYGALADLCKELNKKSSEDSGEDSSEDSESSGTLYAKEILETRQLYREYMIPLNARCLAETQQSLRPIRPEQKQR